MINMKKITGAIIFTLVVFLSGINIVAQEVSQERAELDSLVTRMFQAIDKKDYDIIFDMSHPAIFDIASREMLLLAIKATFEGNEEFAVEIDKGIPNYKLSPVYKDESEEENGRLYAFASYNMGMVMTFKQQEFDEEAKEMMHGVFATQGMDVTFTSNNTLHIIKKNSLTILLRDIDTEGKWVMINYDPDSPFFYNVLPKSIIKSARAYNQELMLDSKE